MKTSNITFASNVYVLTESSKLADKQFMSHVIDPNAINEIVQTLHSDAILSKLQREIRMNANPCALADAVNGVKDYTHGTIIEDGKYICVNTCEKKDCKLYSQCSHASDFRKIERVEDITPIDAISEVKDSELSFHVDFGDESSTSKVRKLKVKKLSGSRIHEEIETIIHSIDEKTWGVRGHWRHLADGTITWVRPHRRHHDEDSVPYPITHRFVVKKQYHFKNKEQLERFKVQVAKLKKQLTQSQIIENALKDDIRSYQLRNISLLDDAKCIITSSIDSRILVNAGPGTGKTHTVIERLKYIASNMEDEVDPESVLILCFSRSAVKVIRERLEEAMAKGEISYIARNFTVSTFDSFATWYIMQVDPNYDLSGLSYDARIERFIWKYNFDCSILNESLSYLIIDEVQDLVGIRAKLVQTLLEKITCGFLLLGDECQAIYDYRIENPDELNATKLYEWLEEHFGKNLTEYELTRNWRNPGKIGESMKPLRSAMLNHPFEIQRDELNKVFKRYKLDDMDIEDMLQCCNDGSGETRAILSYSNGDAYRQSQELYTRSDINIAHTVLSGSRRVIYRRELADIFSDYNRPRLSAATFYKKCEEKGINRELAKDIWDGIIYVTDKNPDDDDIDMSELKQAILREKRVSERLAANEKAEVTISTIHKAKGKEYDMVILNKSGKTDSAESVKVYYVALTRAKKELIVKTKRSYAIDIKTETGRYVELSKGYDSKIKRVELGLDGDIDPIGFVDKKLPGLTVEARQNYIANSIHVGDPVKISKFHNEYLISHNGYFIGRVTPEAFQPFKRYYPSGKYFTYNFNNYTDFDELYVKDVVTIVNKKLDARIGEPYSESGFWYGIEFCGYAKTREE